MFLDFVREHRALTALFVAYNLSATLALTGTGVVTFIYLLVTVLTFTWFVVCCGLSLLRSHEISTERPGTAWSGEARRAEPRYGTTRRGMAGRGVASQGTARRGKARTGRTWRGTPSHGGDGPGRAGRDMDAEDQ